MGNNCPSEDGGKSRNDPGREGRLKRQDRLKEPEN
jgi:hypothetical protein